jgi:hypothetical protein
MANSVLVLGRRDPGILQRLVERESNILRRDGPIEFLSVNEQRRGCVHSKVVAFVQRGAHGLFILSLETCLQLRDIKVMLLGLQSGQPVEFRILTFAAFFSADGMLISMQVISIIPVGVTFSAAKQLAFTAACIAQG